MKTLSSPVQRLRRKRPAQHLWCGRPARGHGRFLAAAVLALAVGQWPLAQAEAAQPKVDFDLGYVVECHDVTGQAFALLHPNEKVIEANLRISVRLARGEEKDIDQLLIEIASPAERLRVVDFLPKTQLESEAADGIEVTKTTETTRTLGAGASSGGFSLSASEGKAHAAVGAQVLPSANANASTTHRNELKETSKKIAPRKVVVASGTLDNEHGVFFKLKRSAAASFEGTRFVSFRFVVPADWRGDWVVVSAQARGTFKRSLFFKAVEPCGETKAFVGLHLAGDAAAERAALELAESQEMYLAGGEKQQPKAAIAELALAASPWQIAKPQGAVMPQSAAKPSPALQSRTCHRPFGLGGLFASGDGSDRDSQRGAASDRTTELKQALNRMAKLASAG